MEHRDYSRDYMKKALIDLDLVVYKVGALNDNWHYQYRGESFNSHKDLGSFLKLIHSGNEDEIAKGLADAERCRDPEPWDSVKLSAINYLDEVLQGYESAGLFLTGKGNFRFKHATILPYKGNRDTVVRPTYFNEIRQLYVEAYGAKVSSYMEADDLIGLAQNEDTIIVSTDKDLNMIPGWHNDFEAEKNYFVFELEGYKNFYKQMLLGDPSDNVLGLYGVGKSSKLLKNIDGMEDLKEIHSYVLSQYTSRFGNYAEKFMRENAILLWILHSRENPVTLGEEYWVE